MAFPMTFPGELGGEKDAVAVGSQTCAASLSISHRRLRGPSTEHCQLREFCVEIDDAGRSALHFSLHLLTAVRIEAPNRNATILLQRAPFLKTTGTFAWHLNLMVRITV